LSKKERKKKPLNYRRVKNWVLSLLGLFIIFMAISFSLARMAIKSVPDYKSSIESIISDQTGFKVEVGFLDAEINWLIPRLNLIDVNIFDESGKQHVLHLKEIDLSLDWVTTIKTQFPTVGEITLVGLKAQVGITEKSQLVFQNYIIDDDIDKTLNSDINLDSVNSFQFSVGLKNYINNLNFKILDSQIRFFDFRKKHKTRVLNNFNLLLLNSGDEHTFEIKADLPENYGKHLHMVLDIDGDLFDYKKLNGQAYLSVEDFFAAPWLDDFWGGLGIAANAGVNAKIWIDWEEQSITNVYSKFKLQNMEVHYLSALVESWNLEKLDGEIWWKKNSDGWEFDIRDLKSVRDGNVWPNSSAVSVVMSNTKDELHIRSDYLRVEGVTYLAGMAASVYDAKDPWLALLHKYNPTGDVKYMEAVLPIDQPEKIKLSADFERLGVILPDLEPSGLSGLSGAVEYENGHARLLIDSKNSQMEFKNLFRDAMTFNEVYGVVDVFNQQDEWKVSADSLVVKTPHIETENRLEFIVSKNQKPFLDLTTRFENGDAQYTNKYLPVSIMGEKTINWLDKGIKSGAVTQGGYMFYGNLSDMPFRSSQGVSLALFDVENVHLHYLDNWPDIEGVNATLRFENESMFIKASGGRTYSSNIIDTQVSINNFFSPVLEVKGDVDVELSDIRTFLESSMLRDNKDSYIGNVGLKGDGHLGLNLSIPLTNESDTVWEANLSVDDGYLDLVNEGYKFTEVSGEFNFSNSFIKSSPVSAKLDNQLVKAMVETSQVDEDVNYHIDIEGYLDSKTVLSPIPEVRDYISGFAHWDVGIDVAGSNVKNNELLRIKVSSDLKEVESKFQGPLFKSLEESMPLLMNINFFENSTIKYDLMLSDNKFFKLDEFEKYRYLYTNTPSIKGGVKQYKHEEKLKPIEVDLDYLDVDAFLQIGEGTEPFMLNKKISNIRPNDFLAVSFKAKDMKWQNFNFKLLEFLTTTGASDLLVDNINIETDEYTVSGKGEWSIGWNNKHETSLTANINVKNLGTALKKLDLTGDIKNTHGKIDLRLKWEDMPHNFSWQNLKGDGKLRLRDGVLKKIDAGTGRMLGLFNLKTLFSLDFANQVSKGFSFDKMKADFTFTNGNAHTDNLVIESKAADIYMNGRLDLDDMTVDQSVRVRPHLGSTLTFGTTIVAGPAVGGLVYLFQKVFNPDALTEYSYSVKGDINDPVVRLLSAPSSVDSQGVKDEL